MLIPQAHEGSAVGDRAREGGSGMGWPTASGVVCDVAEGALCSPR
jgi:hypothetical protein